MFGLEQYQMALIAFGGILVIAGIAKWYKSRNHVPGGRDIRPTRPGRNEPK